MKSGRSTEEALVVDISGILQHKAPREQWVSVSEVVYTDFTQHWVALVAFIQEKRPSDVDMQLTVFG